MNIKADKKLTYDELVAKVAALEAELASKTQQLEITASKLEMATIELEKLKRLIFGQKRERFIPAFNPEQLDISLGPIEVEKLTQRTETITYTRTLPQKESKHTPHGRSPIPAHIPRKDIVIEPEEDVSGFKKIGTEITEEFEYEPPKFYVNRYIRIKWLRPDETVEEGSFTAPPSNIPVTEESLMEQPLTIPVNETSIIQKPSTMIVMAELPSRPIEKGMPGPGLLAYILISKFVDHLPLYRQIQQIKRYTDWELASSTVNGWVKGSCELLVPLYHKLKEVALSSDYLQADETPIPVLDSQKKNSTHRGFHWVYHAPLQRLVFFDYRRTRGRDGPNDVLKNFQGYLQTDAYAGYDTILRRPQVIAVGCMSHARRYFIEAQSYDAEKTGWMLTRVQALYSVERQARENGVSFDERYALRQEYALPVLAEMKGWLDKNLPLVPPKSALGKAVAYMLSNWKRLIRYTDDGRLEIDNNWIENQIRPVALGRKNYLFAGSHNGARWAATIYSLVGTAKLNQIDPFVYLRDVLTRISDHPYKKLDELLPPKWTPLQ